MCTVMFTNRQCEGQNENFSQTSTKVTPSVQLWTFLSVGAARTDIVITSKKYHELFGYRNLFNSNFLNQHGWNFAHVLFFFSCYFKFSLIHSHTNDESITTSLSSFASVMYGEWSCGVGRETFAWLNLSFVVSDAKVRDGFNAKIHLAIFRIVSQVFPFPESFLKNKYWFQYQILIKNQKWRKDRKKKKRKEKKVD